VAGAHDFRTEHLSQAPNSPDAFSIIAYRLIPISSD
jgi:hypothetical protein